jgi:hypothetical protein
MILFWLFADIDDRLVNIYNLIDWQMSRP